MLYYNAFITLTKLFAKCPFQIVIFLGVIMISRLYCKILFKLFVAISVSVLELILGSIKDVSKRGGEEKKQDSIKKITQKK